MIYIVVYLKNNGADQKYPVFRDLGHIDESGEYFTCQGWCYIILTLRVKRRLPKKKMFSDKTACE